MKANKCCTLEGVDSLVIGVSSSLCCQDKEYTQLLGTMSERCEDYEEQLLTDEAKLKGRSHCTLLAYILSNLIFLLRSALRRGCYSLHSPLQGSARCHTTGLVQVALSCMCVQVSQKYWCIFILCH